MTRQIVAFALAGAAALAAGGLAAGQDPKRVAELEGAWVLKRMEFEGKSLLKEGGGWRLTVKGGKATSDAKGDPLFRGVDLAKAADTSKTPKALTYHYEGNLVLYGIYEVRGDELRFCFELVDASVDEEPEASRPKGFDGKAGTLLVFQREKK